MTDADIQAIVGFIRSWEPTAPEVATPTRIRGSRWKTSSAPSLPSGGSNVGSEQGAGSQTSQGKISGQGQGTGQAQGANSSWAQPATSWWQNLDSRSVVLVAVVAILAFGLVAISLIRLRRLPPPTA